MSLALNNNSSQSRKRALDAWFVSNGVKKKEVAVSLGLTPQNFSRILSGNYGDANIYSKLISLEVNGQNIPFDLLPPPRAKKKTGPKRKRHND